MTKRSRHNPRPIPALLLVATTVFLLAGSHCGALGTLAAGAARYYLGSAGTALLCVTAWLCALVLVAPPGTLGRLAAVLWRGTAIVVSLAAGAAAGLVAHAVVVVARLLTQRRQVRALAPVGRVR